MHLSYRLRILSLLLLLLSPLLAEEEIRVELSTKVDLAPLYLSRVHAKETPLKPSYLSELAQVLQFDLKHSGYVNLIESDEVLEKALYNSDPSVAFNPQRWSKAGIRFVTKMEVKESKLDLYAYDVRGVSAQLFEGVVLTGTLSKDRKQMHKLSNALMKSLFGVEGVATSHLLFSNQLDTKDPKNWKAEIWSCDWDGGNTRQVTNEQSYSITPIFIPADEDLGGDRFLFVNYKNGQPKIYYSSLKNRSGKPLVDLRGNQLLPAISAKRDQLAFISDAGGRADLFVQKIDKIGVLKGKPEQLFSYPRSTQGSPTFSPNGKQIAFVSDKNGTPRIYIIPSSLENQKRPIPLVITKRNRENTCPSWSPDGTKLAYSAKTNGVRQIWIYDFATEEEEQLTTGPGNKENPCWAPDSLHLVFNSTDPDSSELFLVNLNQPEAVKITAGPGKKHYPTWER